MTNQEPGPKDRIAIKAHANIIGEQEGMAIVMLAGPLALWLVVAALGTIDIQAVAHSSTAIGSFLSSFSLS